MDIDNKYMLKIRNDIIKRRLNLRHSPSIEKYYCLFVSETYEAWWYEKTTYDNMINKAIDDMIEDFVKRSDLDFSEYYKVKP